MNAAKRILFIDDDESIREFLSMALADEGYDVVTAPHGGVGLEMIPHCNPALILLDMRIPVMDGWTFLKQYHDSPGPHAPIIALTASRNSLDTQIPLYVDGFLAKPFDLNDLVRLISQELSERRQ